MFTKMVLKSMLRKWRKGGFTVVFWDGDQENYGDETPAFKVIFNREPTLRIHAEDAVLTLGEAYMDQTIELEGSMDDILRVMTLNTQPYCPNREKLAAPARHDSSDSKIQQQNIQHHYDLGNDFYRLWLDETMSYSCAYFKTPKDSLQQAQLQKIDHILKKLNLQPGEKLLDIGSGWGWLLIRGAQQYHVRATGVTLSQEQYEETKRRIKELGLEDQVNVELISYQDLDPSRMQFDKIVSVGMFEHVGQGNLGRYMNKIHELLVPGGISMLHTITGMSEETKNSWMGKYIFPGGYIPSLREIIGLLPEFDFHLLHLESLRLHYATTLERWYQNFLQHIDEIREKKGERFVRMWSLYLRGCAAAFRVSGLDIYQLLFTKGLNNGLPLTNDYMYNVK